MTFCIPRSRILVCGSRGFPWSARASSTSLRVLWTASSPKKENSLNSSLEIIYERQTLAVSLPLMYWNSFGVIQDPLNQTHGPLLPWHSFERYLCQYQNSFHLMITLIILTWRQSCSRTQSPVPRHPPWRSVWCSPPAPRPWTGGWRSRGWTWSPVTSPTRASLTRGPVWGSAWPPCPPPPPCCCWASPSWRRNSRWSRSPWRMSLCSVSEPSVKCHRLSVTPVSALRRMVAGQSPSPSLLSPVSRVSIPRSRSPVPAGH